MNKQKYVGLTIITLWFRILALLVGGIALLAGIANGLQDVALGAVIIIGGATGALGSWALADWIIMAQQNAQSNYIAAEVLHRMNKKRGQG